MKEETIKKWKEQQSIVRLIIFTFLGGVIQFLTAFPFFWDFLITPIEELSKRNPNSLPPLLDSPYFVGLYFGITMIYSIATSLSFPPKRIVSPINIQMITWGLLLLIIPLAITYRFPNYPITLESVITLSTYLFMIAAGFGLAQTIFVKFLIGMNGSKDDLIRDTFGINTDFETVKKTLQSRSFKDVFYFKTPIKFIGKRDVFVMKSDLNTSEEILIVLKPDITDEESCSLSVVSFESKYYQIQQTSRMKQKHEIVLNELKKRLGNKVHFTDKDLDNDISEFAADIALGRTNNRLEHLRELSAFNKAALIGLGTLFGIITYLRYGVNQLNQDSYISISIFILIAVVIDLLPRFTRTRTELDY